MDSEIYELTCGQCKDRNTSNCNFCKYGSLKTPKRKNLQEIEEEMLNEEDYPL